MNKNAYKRNDSFCIALYTRSLLSINTHKFVVIVCCLAHATVVASDFAFINFLLGLVFFSFKWFLLNNRGIMERTKRDLESVISSQNEQLTRYEKRLKDVVTAYKGLLKEKEALETSLSALTATKADVTGEDDNEPSSEAAHTRDKNEKVINNEDVMLPGIDDKANLQTQIHTLMNSLATLSAEKSRMEASFQNDKKQLRVLLTQKDQTINDLQKKIKENQDNAKNDIEDVKAKWIIERQEREKETNNQILMIRELQKLYADERHLKENIEMQLNNFKTQFASNEAENYRLRDLQAQLKDANAQLKQFQTNSKHLNIEQSEESSNLLKQVQQEMRLLKEQHAVAIKNEQKRAQLAEEQSRNQAALHEDRVANLEARLAELSTTVGTYDRLRQQDQESIHVLKRQLQDLERSTLTTEINNDQSFSYNHSEKERILNKLATNSGDDLSEIVDEIMRLKKILLTGNSCSSNPIDLNKIFSVATDHTECQDELNRVTFQLEAAHTELKALQEKLTQQKTHIATLQDKVQVLNTNIEDQELELKQHNEKLRLAVKDERTKWKERQNDLENEYRGKLNDLEQQLHKQRSRSLRLLDEKEQEIKTLQTSFEIFHSNNHHNISAISETNNAVSSDAESDDEAHHLAFPQKKLSVKPKKLAVSDSCHMLHYANEIARKDIEITNLRKSRYVAEASMRKAIQEKVAAQEELLTKISALEEHVDRLERCKTREGANLEYLKNVIISYIVSKDPDGRRHMMNAISAVLQFTPAETQAINSALHKK
ncbi:GRIP and coiled-coil domain-containing protein 1 [Glossina fuscipes]|uniref:GRIP and coiled-coil domain-containing protein 1 n=1 Tax=Glossina fuscipes TaxID=7396 RepID=A0A9C5ZCI8_9MUSC|nr:GRIP and coiled-coil domain-containing protein 1 [Glossina fuscipes]